jgi:hypothetical protein
MSVDDAERIIGPSRLVREADLDRCDMAAAAQLVVGDL